MFPETKFSQAYDNTQFLPISTIQLYLGWFSKPPKGKNQAAVQAAQARWPRRIWFSDEIWNKRTLDVSRRLLRALGWFGAATVGISGRNSRQCFSA